MIQRYPRVVWLLTGYFALILFAYTILLPTYRSPDEPNHVDLIMAVREDLDYRGPTEAFQSRQMLASLDLVQFDDRSANLTKTEAIPRSERPTFDDLGSRADSSEPNQLTQHPPLYYGSMALVSTVITAVVPIDDLGSFDRLVALMRLLNIPLTAALVPLGYEAARRLGFDEPARLAVAAFATSVPQLAHIGSAVNNDNLMVPLFAVLSVLTIPIMRGDRSVRTAVLTGVALGLLLFTKGFALVAPIWVVFAYLVAPDLRRHPATVGSRLAIVAGVSFAAGGWWWLRNLIVFGTIQPHRVLNESDPAFDPDPALWIERYLTWMSARFWGWFGWFDVRLPAWLTTVATLVVLGLLVVGSVAWRGRRVEVASLLAPAVLVFVVWGSIAYETYTRTGLTAGIQGRYLFPGIVGIAAVAAAGATRLAGSRPWVAPLAVLAAGTVLHLVSARRLLNAYWGRPGASLWAQLDALQAWAPWPPAVLVVAFAALAATWAALAANLYRRVGSATLEHVDA